MRSMVSGAAFHRAYQRATQQAFLEAHEHAFGYFGWRFSGPELRQFEVRSKEDTAGLPPRGNCTIHRFPLALALRQRVLHIPKARDLAELNAQLMAACRADDPRVIAGGNEPVGTMMIEERAHLSAAGRAGFRAGASLLPARGWAGVRAGADQPVFGSGQTWQNGRSAALSDLCGSPGRRPVYRKDPAYIVNVI